MTGVVIQIDADWDVLLQTQVDASNHHLPVLQRDQLVHLTWLQSLAKRLRGHVLEFRVKVVEVRDDEVGALVRQGCFSLAALRLVLGQARQLYDLFFLSAD